MRCILTVLFSFLAAASFAQQSRDSHLLIRLSDTAFLNQKLRQDAATDTEWVLTVQNISGAPVDFPVKMNLYPDALVGEGRNEPLGPGKTRTLRIRCWLKDREGPFYKGGILLVYGSLGGEAVVERYQLTFAGTVAPRKQEGVGEGASWGR